MDLYDFTVTNIDGQSVSLAQYRARVLLVVNVASKCGFTPQYAQLEAAYRKFQGRGFSVLGFPCDQFGHQEPGSEAQIKDFCERNYGVSFPMFAKIEVNGANTHPLYRYLKAACPGVLGSESIKWNFTKFLVARDGLPFKRYAPADRPAALEAQIESLLA